jgi:hypothetical protein
MINMMTTEMLDLKQTTDVASRARLSVLATIGIKWTVIPMSAACLKRNVLPFLHVMFSSPEMSRRIDQREICDMIEEQSQPLKAEKNIAVEIVSTVSAK